MVLDIFTAIFNALKTWAYEFFAFCLSEFIKLFNSLIAQVISLLGSLVDSLPVFEGSTATFITYIGFINKFLPIVELFGFIAALVVFTLVVWVVRLILKAIPGIW